MIKIENVVVPSKGTGKYFTIDCLQIKLNRQSKFAPTLYWEVKKATPYAIDEVQVEIPGDTILSGNLHMTEEEYAQWTLDDGYVIDWALDKLGFVEVVETPAE